jgi:hypothetical protein
MDSAAADLGMVAAGTGMAAVSAGADLVGGLVGDLDGDSVGDGIHGIGIHGGVGAVRGVRVMGTTLRGLEIITIRQRIPSGHILRLTVPAIREAATTMLRRTRMHILIPARTTIRRT